MNNENIEKRFISANEITVDAFRLASLIEDSEYIPTKILSLLRGGAPISIAIHEFLSARGTKVQHLAVHCSSYTGIGEQENEIHISGISTVVEQTSADDRILIVDDVFDTGRSIEAVMNSLAAELDRKFSGRHAIETKVATLWYKPEMNQTDRTPDFYLHETNKWLVFPHEIIGLTEEEILENKPGVPPK